MKKFWQFIGLVSYFALLPALHPYLRFSKRTRIAAVNADALLVVKPWLGNRKWSLPGGGVHKGETPEAAVMREAKEETGIILTAVEHTAKHIYHSVGLRFSYELFYVSSPTRVTIKNQQLEIIEAGWVEISELNNHNANQDVLTVVKWLQQR